MAEQWQWLDEPREASTRAGGSTRVLMGPANAGATDAFVVDYRLAPGDRMTEHYHPYTDEHLVVVAGVLTAVLEGESVTCREGQSLFVRRGCRHALENRSSHPVRVLAALAPLAPSPSLGHVETEPVPVPDAAHPQVGGPR